MPLHMAVTRVGRIIGDFGFDSKQPVGQTCNF